MRAIVCSSPEEYDEVIAREEAKGLTVVCVSNLGLPKGKVRVTFREIVKEKE